MLYMIHAIKFGENDSRYAKTLAVLEGPSGLDLRATELDWIKCNIPYVPKTDMELWYLVNRQKLKVSAFVDYLIKTFGMTKVSFVDSHETSLKED